MVNIKNGINYIEQSDNLTTLLSDETPYILYFTASWCGPCRMISPEFEKLKQNYPNIDFYKIDIDECEEISSLFNIRSVPTFYLYKKKREYYNKCEGADQRHLSELLLSLNSLYPKTVDKTPEPIEIKNEPIEENIESMVDNIESMVDNSIYYNNMDSMSNYEQIEPPEHINIKTNSDLDKFFETMNLDIDNTETNDIKPSDLSDISVLNI